MKRCITLIVSLLLILMACSAFADSNVTVAFEATTYETILGRKIKVVPVIQGYKGSVSYEYFSSDTTIATVTSQGNVTPISKGTVTITCICKTKTDSYSASYTLNVLVPVKKITVAQNKVELSGLSEVFSPDITIEPEDASNKEIIWKSSNKNVAVYSNGSIRAIDVGSATITGTAADGSGAKVSYQVTIPQIFVSANEIIIDSLDGVDFSYRLNMSGIITSNLVASNCVRIEPVQKPNDPFSMPNF